MMDELSLTDAQTLTFVLSMMVREIAFLSHILATACPALGHTDSQKTAQLQGKQHLLLGGGQPGQAISVILIITFFYM